jgi:hypothetical protein
MNDQENKRKISSQKLAANRSNAKRSTGPRTEAGKAKAAQNSYKHGFFALRLFPTSKLRAQDGADYNMVYNGLYSHYAPVGFMEHFWLEKVATEALRLARVLEYGQQVLDWQMPFETRSVDKLLRYESTVTRNFAQAVKSLELLQAEGETESSQLDEPTDSATGPVAGQPEPTPSGLSPAPEEAFAEEATLVSTSEEVSEAHSAVEDKNADSTETAQPNPTDLEPHQATESVQNPTPPAAICETNRPSSCRWVETVEDEEVIQGLHKELYGHLPL